MLTTEEANSSTAALSEGLRRVAESPAQTRQLHAILGGYCHQIRNLLNCLNMSLYLARRGGAPATFCDWSDVEHRYRSVEQFIDRLQSICRPISLNVVRLPLALLIEDRKSEWSKQVEASGRRLLIEPPSEPAVGGFDPVRLGQCFDDLVDWRSRAGDPGGDLRVRWKTDDRRFRVIWDEPKRERVLDPKSTHPVLRAEAFDSLTVPVLTRVVRLHGGDAEVRCVDGWRLSLSWPVDASHMKREAPG